MIFGHGRSLTLEVEDFGENLPDSQGPDWVWAAALQSLCYTTTRDTLDDIIANQHNYMASKSYTSS
jgi:hypothetical protein